MVKDIIKAIQKCSFEHPARLMPFDNLINGLDKEVNKGNIREITHSYHKELKMYLYSSHAVFNDEWNIFTLMARGLIIDTKNKEVLAAPFTKFFNYGEVVKDPRTFFEEPYIVTEKVDGSMGIMFFYENKWRIATKGSFESKQAKWAEEWIYQYMPLDKIDANNTYIFEIVYPENKIIVDYDFSGLVLLGIIDSFGLEYPYEQMVEEAKYLNVMITKKYTFVSIEDILKKAKVLSKLQEGFVIRFKNGIRLKVKGEEYLRIHKAISDITPVKIWQEMLDGKNLDNKRKDIPEEYIKDFDKIISILENKLDTFIEEVRTIYENTKDKTDKELGMYMKFHPEAFAGCKFISARNYVFSYRKGRFYQSIYDLTSSTRRNIFKLFKPVNNKLEGYNIVEMIEV